MYKNGSTEGIYVETTTAETGNILHLIHYDYNQAHALLQYIYHAACLAELQTVNPQTLQQLPVQRARRTS